LYAARAVDTAVALLYEPAEKAYEIPNVELMKGLLMVGVYRGEVRLLLLLDYLGEVSARVSVLAFYNFFHVEVVPFLNVVGGRALS